MSEEYVMNGIRDLLVEGVDNELISDVPVCTILSGGVDSTIITYLLKQRIPNLQAFVVSMGDTGKKDDLYYARMASKEIGVPLHEIIIDKDWVEQNLCKAIYAIEDYYLIDVDLSIKDQTIANLKKYIFRDKVEVLDYTDETGLISIQGSDSEKLIKDMLSYNTINMNELSSMKIKKIETYC